MFRWVNWKRLVWVGSRRLSGHQNTGTETIRRDLNGSGKTSVWGVYSNGVCIHFLRKCHRDVVTYWNPILIVIRINRRNSWWCSISTTLWSFFFSTRNDCKTKTGNQKNEQNLFHLILNTIGWFRRTQYITSIGLFYKKWESWGGEFSGE